MKSPFLYSNDNKRYHTWNYFLRKKFGQKVSKVALNGGFTCPNIDGMRGTGGCSYCLGGSGEFAGDPAQSISQQLAAGREKLASKWGETLYMPYFQANTNTYAPLARLRELYETALAQPGVCALAIATRPDCIADDVLDYLAEIAGRTYLLVELGLQSIFDATGERINRCHSYGEFLACYERLASRGIDICVHLIMGLPGETREMMLESVRAVAKLRPACVKLHLLHILKGTKMAEEYARGEVRCMELEEYVGLIADALEMLPAQTAVQRLTGDGARDSLVAPLWSLKKFVVLNEIDKELQRRDTMQGARFEG